MILQDSFIHYACHVETSRVYRFAKIIGYIEAGDHLVKFVNIHTLKQHLRRGGGAGSKKQV